MEVRPDETTLMKHMLFFWGGAAELHSDIGKAKELRRLRLMLMMSMEK